MPPLRQKLSFSKHLFHESLTVEASALFLFIFIDIPAEMLNIEHRHAAKRRAALAAMQETKPRPAKLPVV